MDYKSVSVQTISRLPRYLNYLKGLPKGSISNILLPVRIIRKKKGKSIYPDKYIYWLYGSIVLTGCKPAWVYRLSVREWERLRLLRERKKLCR